MMKRFWKDTSGAVTVDWVALTAGVLLVGITVVYAIYTDGVGALSKSLNSAMSSVDAGIDTGDVPAQSTFTVN